MKRFIIIITILLIVCGCTKNNEEKKDIVKKEKKEDVVDTYKDNNVTPIGIYKLEGNTLTRLNKINVTPAIEQEIGTFQIFPSFEESVVLNKGFGLACYDEWEKYKDVKLGINIKFSLSDGENISYNIFSPENTFDKWEYLMNYLYDDYANFGKGFYSHMEKEDFNENSLITSLKIQSSYSIGLVNSKIVVTAFTYDTEDDIKDNEYRGNSSHSMTICLLGREC